MIRQAARDALRKYLAEELGRSLHLPDIGEISRQRSAFLSRFGPDVLDALSGPELLRTLPYNAADEQPMDYWLEFKNDEEFSTREFGSIAGGSAAKFGPWQDKKTGSWRNKRVGERGIEDISEDTALELLKVRRDEMIAAVKVAADYHGKAVDQVDPEAFQAAVVAAAPRWGRSAWLHKYLHLNYPDLVTWSATLAYAQADLYRVGVTAVGSGLYALDIKTIQFWNSLPELSELPVQVRYRVGRGLSPRDHWCLGLSGEVSAWKDMLAGEYLGLGPRKVGDLSEVFALTKKREANKALKAALVDAKVSPTKSRIRDLIDLGWSLTEGSIVALLSEPGNAVAVGEVTGGYVYAAGEDRPHRVPVLWHHHANFELAAPVALERSLVWLDPSHPAVADVEASLLANGVAHWPGYREVVRGAAPVPDVPLKPSPVGGKGEPEPLEPPTGPIRQISEMLKRKLQVILYGPPGTGKTYHAQRVALDLIARDNFRCLPSQLAEAQRKAIHGKDGSDPFLATCTFHPAYSYEDFIEGYRADGQGFALKHGIFRRMVKAAQAQPGKTFILIIDEINRGNIPKIFGELITLIEVSKRGTTHSILPLSGDSFSVPRNLLLIGTMNTADRSILLLDTALRRRFAFKELMPDPELLREGRIGDVSLSTWLRALNRRIVEHLGRDGRNLQVGHAYLMPGGRPVTTLRRVAEIVQEEIWPLLQEYCYDDHRALGAILAGAKGIYDEGRRELRHELFEAGREEQLVQALAAIITPEDKTAEAFAEDDEEVAEDSVEDGEDSA